jgi:hypothetical protein
VPKALGPACPISATERVKSQPSRRHFRVLAERYVTSTSEHYISALSERPNFLELLELLLSQRVRAAVALPHRKVR